MARSSAASSKLHPACRWRALFASRAAVQSPPHRTADSCAWFQQQARARHRLRVWPLPLPSVHDNLVVRKYFYCFTAWHSIPSPTIWFDQHTLGSELDDSLACTGDHTMSSVTLGQRVLSLAGHRGGSPILAATGDDSMLVHVAKAGVLQPAGSYKGATAVTNIVSSGSDQVTSTWTM